MNPRASLRWVLGDPTNKAVDDPRGTSLVLRVRSKRSRTPDDKKARAGVEFRRRCCPVEPTPSAANSRPPLYRGEVVHSGSFGASGFSSVASRTDRFCSSALTVRSVAQNSSSALIGSLNRRIAYAC